MRREGKLLGIIHQSVCVSFLGLCIEVCLQHTFYCSTFLTAQKRKIHNVCLPIVLAKCQLQKLNLCSQNHKFTIDTCKCTITMTRAERQVVFISLHPILTKVRVCKSCQELPYKFDRQPAPFWLSMTVKGGS